MRIKLEIPKSLNDLELSRYQEVCKIAAINPNGGAWVDAKLLQIVTGLDKDTIDKIDLKKFTTITTTLNELISQKGTFEKEIRVNGVDFGFIPKLEDIKTGAFIDLEKYMQDPKDYHKAMAVMYRPITTRVNDSYLIEEYEGSEKYSNLMLDSGAGYCVGALLFFWTLANELMIDTAASLREDLTTMNMVRELSSGGNTGGINPSSILQITTLLESTALQSSQLMPFYSN